jgi:hypothetical protein
LEPIRFRKAQQQALEAKEFPKNVQRMESLPSTFATIGENPST